MNSFSDGSGGTETVTADTKDQKFIVILSVPEMPTSKAYGKALAHTRQAMWDLGHRVVLLAPSSEREDLHGKQAVDINASDLIYRTLRKCINWRIGPAFTVAIRHYLSFKFKRLCKDLKPDMIWTRDVITATKLQRLHVPIVLEEHHVPSRRQKRRYRRLLKNLRSVSLVAISEPIRISLKKLSAHEVPVMVEASGVAEEFFRIQPAPMSSVGPIRIGYLGSVSGFGVSKGIANVVGLWPEVHKLSRDLELHVYGWNESLEQPTTLTAISQPEINLHLYPSVPVPQVASLLASFDALLAPYPDDPSTQGMSPLKLSEYAGSRRPILATESSPVRNSLKDGMYQTFDLTDPHSLTKAVLMMRSQPETTRKMVEDAYFYVSERRWGSRTARIIDRVPS